MKDLLERIINSVAEGETVRVPLESENLATTLRQRFYDFRKRLRLEGPSALAARAESVRVTLDGVAVVFDKPTDPVSEAVKVALEKEGIELERKKAS